MHKKFLFLPVCLIAQVCCAATPARLIAELADASHYNIGQSGPAGVQSRYAEPYQTLLQKGTLKEIKELYEKGSSAGKLYALTALQQKDKNELIRILEKTDFSKLQRPVIIQMGGVVNVMSFLDGVSYVLQPEFIRYLPRPKGTNLEY